MKLAPGGIVTDFVEPSLHLVHPLRELFELSHQGLDAAGAQAQFLDELQAFAAAAKERLASHLALGEGRRFSNEPAEIAAILRQQAVDRRQVMWHAGRDLIFGKLLGERDFDRPVERQLAAIDLLERLDGSADGVIAGQQSAAESLAGDFDLLGQRDFFRAGKQRNVRHLGQI